MPSLAYVNLGSDDCVVDFEVFSMAKAGAVVNFLQVGFLKFVTFPMLLFKFVASAKRSCVVV